MKKKIIASVMGLLMLAGTLPSALAEGTQSTQMVERLLHTPQMIQDGLITETNFKLYADWIKGRAFDRLTGNTDQSFCGVDKGTFDINNPNDICGVMLDLGEDGKSEITKIKYYPREGNASRLCGVFEGSNDGITWQTIHDVGAGNVTQNQWYTAEKGAYRFADATNYEANGLQNTASFDLNKSVWKQAAPGESFRYLRYSSYWRNGNDIGEIEFYTQKPVRNVTNAPQHGTVELSFAYFGTEDSKVDGSVDTAGPKLDLSRYAAGDILSVKAVPEAGYSLNGLTVTRDTDNSEVTVTPGAELGAYTFRIPDSDVTIHADFKSGDSDITGEIGAQIGELTPGEASASVAALGSAYNASVVWKDLEGVFAPSADYTATVTLTANPSYQFPADTQRMTVNGISYPAVLSNGNHTLTASVTLTSIPAYRNNAYQLGTEKDLRWFAAKVNAGALGGKSNAVLTEDIDLANVPWIPIGDCRDDNKGTNGYSGIFDGQGHIISNLTLCVDPSKRAEPIMEYTGFFGALLGTVQNLHLRHVTVPSFAAPSDSGTLPGVGSLAGRNNGTVVNCSAEDVRLEDITVLGGYSKNELSGAGGLAGFSQALIFNSYVKDVTISGTIQNAGGLVGYSGWGGPVIDNCCVYGTVCVQGTAGGPLAGLNKKEGEVNLFYQAGALVNGSPVNEDQGGAIAKTPDEFAFGPVTDLLNGRAGENPDYFSWYQGAGGPVLRSVEQADFQPQKTEEMTRESAVYHYNGQQVFDKGFGAEYRGPLNGKTLGMTFTRETDGKTSSAEFHLQTWIEGEAAVQFGFLIQHIPAELQGKITAVPWIQ